MRNVGTYFAQSVWTKVSPLKAMKRPGSVRCVFHSGAQQTKVITASSRVRRRILQNVWTTKSIIFTCWTRTLDLIQTYLNDSGFEPQNFKRIDGDCATAKRERILEDFVNDVNLRVLIMTTGTGAVGLNLAVANRVFIVEPQWNPSVENQAIARALRLGQENTVLVTRYIVEGSVEQDMRKLQDTKMERANLVKSG
ncbi:hypothetical protein E8E11_011718 [Didymella keratinophila]|nr:hypothetical protein E8E11_011718 [Didymella keratinophila]